MAEDWMSSTSNETDSDDSDDIGMATWLIPLWTLFLASFCQIIVG